MTQEDDQPAASLADDQPAAPAEVVQAPPAAHRLPWQGWSTRARVIAGSVAAAIVVVIVLLATGVFGQGQMTVHGTFEVAGTVLSPARTTRTLATVPRWSYSTHLARSSAREISSSMQRPRACSRSSALLVLRPGTPSRLPYRPASHGTGSRCRTGGRSGSRRSRCRKAPAFRSADRAGTGGSRG